MQLRSGKQYGTKVAKVVKKRKTSGGTSVAMVRKVVLGLSETKNFVASNLTPPTSFSVGTPYYTNIAYWIGSGSSDAQRIGDSIYITNVEIAATFRATNNTVSDQISWIIMVVETDQEAHDGITGPSMSASLLSDYRWAGTYSNPIINTNVYTVKHMSKGLITPAPERATINPGQAGFVCRSVKVPINRKFQYKSTSSGYEKYKNLFIVVATETAAGGTGTGVASCDLSYVTHFKDI